jgi:ketosteroid isomerase-like protein
MKHSVIYFFFITAAGILAAGCGSSAATNGAAKRTAGLFDAAALRPIIDEKNTMFTRAHITGDTAFLNNIFTQDAKVFAPNADIVVGRSAIALLNIEYINYGIHEFREETTALYGAGEYLINEGTYVMRYGTENTTENGKFINIWRLVDGDWKIQSNIWNENKAAHQTQ